MASTSSYDSSISNQSSQRAFLLASSGVVYAGTFAQLDSTGAYVAMAGANSRKIVGQFVKDSGTVAADTLVPVRAGDITAENSATDPVVIGDAGATVYVEDDKTVCHTAGSLAKAGKFLRFDPVSGKPVIQCDVVATV